LQKSLTKMSAFVKQQSSTLAAQPSESDKASLCSLFSKKITSDHALLSFNKDTLVQVPLGSDLNPAQREEASFVM
jgi:hypothetical protein